MRHYCIELSDEEMYVFSLNTLFPIRLFFASECRDVFTVLNWTYVKEFIVFCFFFAFFIFHTWNNVSTNRKTASESPCMCFAVLLLPNSALGSIIF